MIIRPLSIGGIVLATLLPMIANASAGRWAWAVAALLIGGAWLALQKRRPEAAGFGFVGLVVVAAHGVLVGHPFAWMLAAAVSALVGWDLDHLRSASDGLEQTEHSSAREGIHLRRLFTVAASGTVLAAVAQGVDLRFGLIAALALALVTLLVLRNIVKSARRGG